MRVLIFIFLLVSARAEERVSLDDIEKDNIRAENKQSDKTVPVEESKYATNYNLIQYDQHPYEGLSGSYDQSNNQKKVYIVPQSQTDYRYKIQPQNYDVTNGYYADNANDQKYNIESNGGGTTATVQYYSNIPKGGTQATHEPNQLIYPSEVLVGNRIQSLLQKSAAEKYAKSNDEGIVYVTMPMDKVFAYHLNLGGGQINAKSHTRPVLYTMTSEPSQQISIPVYIPNFSQKFTYPLHSQFPSYAELFPQQVYTQAIFPSKNTKTGHKTSDSHSYTTQTHSQYIQPVVLAKSKALHTQGTPIYTDLYTRTSAHVQDNSLNSQAQKSHQAYVSSRVVEQLAKHVLEEPKINSALQKHVKKLKTSPNVSSASPRHKTEKFRSSVTQLHPIHTGNDIVSSKHYTALSTEPKSLLDTYVPSYVIAAQDSTKYKEKPIKLEGGFLPSKINFIRQLKKYHTE